MKPLFIAACLLFLGCKSHEIAPQNCFKGRLAVKGICLNYTIQLTSGTLDTSKIVSNWVDPVSGKSYVNAFSLVNPCVLNENIKEGDEFYFKLETVNSLDLCMQCKAYYPTPPKALAITLCK
jgi:hypothetical protein